MCVCIYIYICACVCACVCGIHGVSKPTNITGGSHHPRFDCWTPRMFPLKFKILKSQLLMAKLHKDHSQNHCWVQPLWHPLVETQGATSFSSGSSSLKASGIYRAPSWHTPNPSPTWSCRAFLRATLTPGVGSHGYGMVSENSGISSFSQSPRRWKFKIPLKVINYTGKSMNIIYVSIFFGGCYTDIRLTVFR